jgi:hypothetical protein
MRAHWHAIVYAAGQSLMRPPAITQAEADGLHVHVQGESIISGALMEEEGVAASAPTGSAAIHGPLSPPLSDWPSLCSSVNWPGGWRHTELGEVDVGTWMVRVYHRRRCHALCPPSPSPANSTAAVHEQQTPDRHDQLLGLKSLSDAAAAISDSNAAAVAAAAAVSPPPPAPSNRKRKALGDVSGSCRHPPAALLLSMLAGVGSIAPSTPLSQLEQSQHL